MIPVCSAQFNSLHPCGWRPQRKFNPSVSACLQFTPSVWTETRVGFFSSSSTSLQFTPPLRVETLAPSIRSARTDGDIFHFSLSLVCPSLYPFCTLLYIFFIYAKTQPARISSRSAAFLFNLFGLYSCRRLHVTPCQCVCSVS